MTSITDPSPYCVVKRAPFGLTEQIRLRLEEHLHSQALQLWMSTITCGLSSPQTAPTFALPPSFVRYITTLLVHPYFTTQLRHGKPRSSAPGEAHILLQRILQIVGPFRADFATAWRFPKANGRTDPWNRGEAQQDASSDDRISGYLANEESLFEQAEDLWAVVGWAFNSSASCPKRWQYWKRFLDVLSDALIRDWEEREEQNGVDSLTTSMVVKNLPDIRHDTAIKKRRVLRAITADGGVNARNEFKPIWSDEFMAKRPKFKGKTSMSALIGQSDSESEDEDGIRGKTIDEVEVEHRSYDHKGDIEMKNIEGIPGAIDEWGGIESVCFRQRLLVLLSKVTRKGFFLPQQQFFEELSEFLIPLSVPAFLLFTSSFLSTDLDLDYYVALNQVILEIIISSESPTNRNSGPEIDQGALITRYLPFSANIGSIGHNAKVAIVLENMMRLLMVSQCLTFTEELENAVETGIEKRRKKGTRTERGDDADEIRQYWMAAEAKLRLSVRLLKKVGGG